MNISLNLGLKGERKVNYKSLGFTKMWTTIMRYGGIYHIQKPNEWHQLSSLADIQSSPEFQIEYCLLKHLLFTS